MKKHHHFHCRLWVCYFIGLTASFAQVDNNQTSESLRSAIEHKTFSFLVKSMMEYSGMRQMEIDFSVMIKGDWVISRLPYSGRAHQSFYKDWQYAFNSSQFDYQVKVRKKGGWKVTIKTRDLPKQRQLIFMISPKGTATLNVISNDLDPSSYIGTIEIQEN